MTNEITPRVSGLPKAGRTIQHILLADDDLDHCLLFKEALEELHITTKFTFAHNGEELMQLLHTIELLPDILFLDLNMPRKNGLQCLNEIKESTLLKHLPVIIYSTSFQKDVVELLFKQGAQFYIRKPNEFTNIKKAIFEALTISSNLNRSQPSKEKFVLSHVLCNEDK